jgi:hypothetical protein
MSRASHVQKLTDPACNDNGVFGLLPRPTPLLGILAVAAQVAGPVSVSHVADGVMIIAPGPGKAKAA